MGSLQKTTVKSLGWPYSYVTVSLSREIWAKAGRSSWGLAGGTTALESTAWGLNSRQHKASTLLRPVTVTPLTSQLAQDEVTDRWVMC